MNDDGEVLVVDPEPLVAELASRVLRDAGFHTRAASGAEDAMRIATEGAPAVDVVLVAGQLPDGTGLELIRRLRADPRTARISIASFGVMRDADETFRALDAGADDCLRKPLNRAELIARVRSLCRMKRQIDELHRAKARLEELNVELELTATTDALTRLANRRAFETRLAEEVLRAHRYQQPLSLLVVDVDHFKRVNDTHGHAAGDDVLRRVADTLRDGVRGVDMVARFGGEEMVVIAPSTDASGATILGERLRALVAAQRVEVVGEAGAVSLAVTVSVGVAQLGDGEDGGELFTRTDAALYAAKRGGRDRVVVAREEPVSSRPAPLEPTLREDADVPAVPA